MIRILLYQLLVIFLYAVSWYVVALVKKRNDVADIAWGGGFIFAAITAYLVSGTSDKRAILVFVLVLLWGGRLMLHIGVRNRGKPEDRRYQAWREEWGDAYLIRSFLQVFLLQGLLVLLISLPVTWTVVHKGPSLNSLDIIGFFIWFFGFLFEAIGDYQLLWFKNNPKNNGRIMQSGLWRYTRHPNYFGEVVLWWGIFIICVSVPGSWWTIVGPLTITYLILRVSGTPLLEKRFKENKEYGKYVRTTSTFFPLPPKKQGG